MYQPNKARGKAYKQMMDGLSSRLTALLYGRNQNKFNIKVDTLLVLNYIVPKMYPLDMNELKLLKSHIASVLLIWNSDPEPLDNQHLVEGCLGTCLAFIFEHGGATLYEKIKEVNEHVN